MIRIFPVDDAGKPTYVDSWGAPRSGGRTHQGTDILAALGTPIFAVDSGTASAGTDPLGGNVVILRADDGTRYYYAHLDAFGAQGPVSPGDVIGYVGQTGNAQGTTPHLHFEVHPQGGAAVDPYPLLQAAPHMRRGGTPPPPQPSLGRALAGAAAILGLGTVLAMAIASDRGA